MTTRKELVMGKKYRTYSYQFKKELVEQIDAGVISQGQAARENDISPSLITRWMTQVHEGSLIEKPTAREKKLERELEHYKKKVGELTVLADYLKKIAECSQRMKRLNSCVVTQKTLDRSKEPVK